MNHHRPPLFSVGGSSGLGWQTLLDVCKTCERAGYFAFYPSDHLMTVQAGKGPSPDRLDALAALAALSAHTSTLRLGVLVANNLFRHPVVTAKILNTIDHASNGRAELGLGAGWAQPEHDAHGFPFPPPPQRIDMLDEALSVIKALWTTEPANFKGTYYNLRDAPHIPKPIQKPHPPIIVGGISPRTMRVALKHADDWDQIAPIRQVARNIQRFRDQAAENRRNLTQMRFSVQTPFNFVQTRAQANRIIDNAIASLNYGAQNPAPGYNNLREHIADSRLLGSPDEITDQIGRWIDAGVNHFILTTPRPFSPEPLETFIAKVAPAFR